MVTEFQPAVKEVFSGGEGLTFEDLISKLGELWNTVSGAIKSAAGSFAQMIVDFMKGDGAESTIGEKIGWLAGTIVFEVALNILTSGAWAAVGPIGKAVKFIAKCLDWTGAVLGMAFKHLGKLAKYIGKALPGLKKMVGGVSGGALGKVFGALGAMMAKLDKWGAELMQKLGIGKVVEEGAESLAGKAGKNALPSRGADDAVDLGAKAGDSAPSTSAAGSSGSGIDSTGPQPAPASSGSGTAPKADGPDPTPKTDAPDPGPKSDGLDPKPEAETPEPKPKAETPEPKTKAETPEPKPKAKTPEPKPKVETPEPKQKGETPKPKPKAETPEPKPKAETPGEAFPGTGKPDVDEFIAKNLERLKSGDPAAIRELLDKHGTWRDLMTHMDAMSKVNPDFKKAAEEIVAWRKVISDEIEASGAFIPPASKEYYSDIDISFSGPRAGENMLAYEQKMIDKYGPNWTEKLRMNFYTDPAYLHKYSDIVDEIRKADPAKFAKLQKELTNMAEEMNFMKMLHHADGNVDALARVKTTIKEIRPDINIDDLLVKARKEFDPANMAKAREDLFLDIDAIYRQLQDPNLPIAKRIELSEQMTKKQMKANMLTEEAYIGPGANRMVVDKVPVNGPEAYQAAISQLEMMEHIVATRGGSFGKVAREYELYKYMERMGKAMENAGIPMSQAMKNAQQLGEFINNKANRHLPAKLNIPDSALDEAFEIYMKEARKQLIEFRKHAMDNLDEWAPKPVKVGKGGGSGGGGPPPPDSPPSKAVKNDGIGTDGPNAKPAADKTKVDKGPEPADTSAAKAPETPVAKANPWNQFQANSKGTFKNPTDAAKAYQFWKDGKWAELEKFLEANRLGSGRNWPPNRGFVSIQQINVTPGTKIDRFGGDGGSFVSPIQSGKGVPYGDRALPYPINPDQYSVFEVVKPIPGVKAGQAIPWFGKPGMGTQWELPMSIDDLIQGGYIKEVRRGGSLFDETADVADDLLLKTGKDDLIDTPDPPKSKISERRKKYKEDAQALDNDGGHAYKDHGAQVTEAQHKKRLTDGTTPGGEVRDIPSSSSSFATHKAQADAYQLALTELENVKYKVRRGRTTDRLKKKVEVDIILEGGGFSYKLAPDGTLQKEKTDFVRAVFKLDEATNKYSLVTMFPTNELT